ncbi:SAM-dependent methyltransferase [uncultured Methanomethylovorans sp.]|uniref:SAM-dependent methyltransferase n=1 Tax=uncultured Methanomethylovorans sp. TaxID=183759 RepID=UPI002615A4E2|nr:SAM-dependent methyltransferase [uncultured Methanomethylovorans sp.]
MRLDTYLVDMGYFSSRARAKDAIIRGNVKVGGNIVTKPSRDVSTDHSVEVVEGLDMPKGYFKLKLIQEAAGIICKGDSVLDLGSSAGGFLLYASQIAGKVRGIEFSTDFRAELDRITYEHANVSVMFGDVFTLPLQKISPDKVDVILSDMTLEPMDSLLALKRVLPLLREEGKLLQVIKMKKREARDPIISKIEDLGVEVVQVIEPQKQEIYVIACKTGKQNEVCGVR